MIKIAIADDHFAVREGICSVIRNFKPEVATEPAMEISLETKNGQELVEKISDSYLPDIILMDIKMPILNGLEATKILLKKFPALKIIMLTMYDENQFILESLEIGAKSYLLKDAEPSELKAAILAVHQRGFYFNERISLAMSTKIGGLGKPKIKFGEILSEREIEVVKLICQGLTNKEIGDALYPKIAETTAKGHCEKIREKMGVRNRVEIVICAIQNGLVRI
jgi:DNA-binding NarL/FixJ family response regulator